MNWQNPDAIRVNFAPGIEKMQDLRPGMKLPGIITNVTAFGAFADIGVHQDGLIHISELADRFVKNPADVVKVHQKVMVTVMEVDLERKRVSLSMKSVPGTKPEFSAPKSSPGQRPVKPPPKAKEKNTPFNNPFADVFGRK